MALPSLTEKSNRFVALIQRVEFTQLSPRALSPESGINNALRLLSQARKKKNSVYLVGNGGSSAIASHVITDFTNIAGLRARTLHESSLLTCMANDYGYENGFARLLRIHALKGDVLIAISSSGKSKNILNAVETMKKAGGRVFTLSGFSRENPLRKAGHLNLWLDSHDYGLVEIAHLFILHHLAEKLNVKG